MATGRRKAVIHSADYAHALPDARAAMRRGFTTPYENEIEFKRAI
jgi:hypothetical protein